MKHRSEFWNGVLRAIGTDPRAAREIGGASGVRHVALAVGVDETDKRIVVVSASGDARSAALAQADIQSAVSEYKVIVARPTVVSAAQVATAVASALGTSKVSLRSLGMFEEADEDQAQPTPIRRPSAESVHRAFESYFSGAMGIVDQWTRISSSVGAPPFLQVIKNVIDQLSLFDVNIDDDDITVNLSRAIESSPVSLDQQLGVCGFPLYAMTEPELDAFLGGAPPDEAQAILRRYGVMQFFFPAPDQLFLGTLDRAAPVAGAEEPTAIARSLGHPAGPMELVPLETKVADLIDALHDRNFLVSGELELSAEGLQERRNCDGALALAQLNRQSAYPRIVFNHRGSPCVLAWIWHDGTGGRC